ncbi:MAG: hypothetical protein L0H23_00350 [Luteimonas sp.]|nr:hypothetical protein [Luteimonas sp.]
MTARQAEQFFKLGERIDERRYHHDFDTAPCMITGTVDAGGRVWEFSINGAAKAKWRDGDEVRYFGCTVPECADLAMWEYTPPDIK